MRLFEKEIVLDPTEDLPAFSHVFFFPSVISNIPLYLSEKLLYTYFNSSSYLLKRLFDLGLPIFPQ